MTPNAHRVRRQSWHLRVGSATDAFAARARLRAEVDDLLPALSDVFDAWAPDGVILRLPRLELTVRVASLDELAGALGEALRHAPQRPAGPSTGAAGDADELAVLLRYLETGLVEWHAAQAESTEMARWLRVTLLANLRAVAVSAPPDNAPFERAWECYVRLLQLLPEERWQDVAAIESRRSASGSAATAGPAGTSAVRGRPADELAEAMAAIVSPRVRPGRGATLVLAAAVLASARTKALPAELRTTLSRTAGVDALSDAPRVVARFLGVEAGAQAAAVLGSPPAPSPRPRPAESPPAQAAPQAFALVAANAGLVLLHPFLPTLFEECGLYQPRRELESRLLPCAAALLHWLATGRDELHEFELGAVKVLLGLHPESPLPVTAGLLGERERDESAALLHAAIGHWKALKDTSMDGLRVSFLQRRGALREEDAGWRIQLESESFDVLLRQLPWGIATVKLPWMTRPLFIDWPTL